VKALVFRDGKLEILDQSLLPGIKKYHTYEKYEEVAQAIQTMKVRGAPAIGVAAAYGIVLAAASSLAKDKQELVKSLEEARKRLASTRPTAVNLFWALDRMKNIWENCRDLDLPGLKNALLEEARKIDEEDLSLNRKLGQFGNELIPDNAVILTHCNAGALATAGYGTALGVIRAAWESGKNIKVYADETRPLLQGARLTAWELMEDRIPVTLITDSMAAYLMQQDKIGLVIVGADRITARGDVANKIGTYGLAVIAHYHGVPFYVAAPRSTIDMNLDFGHEIPIEERPPEEIRRIGDVLLAPAEVPVYNPAFDVTPAKLVTAIITEAGVVRPPYPPGLKRLFSPPEE
jgi:methylthioribose-1-phosphate isomerase